MTTKKNSPKTQRKAVVTNKDGQKRLTVYFGYGLFLLTLISLGASLLFSWNALEWFPFLEPIDVVLMLVSFAFAALAPPLVGYLVGDGATRSKSRIVHQYNGVLFGVLGVWFWAALSLLTTVVLWSYAPETNFENTLLSMAPAIVAAAATITLGVAYARATRHQVSLIDYAPYRWTLIAALVGVLSGFGLSTISGLYYGGSVFMGVLINLTVPLLFLLTTTLIGYWIIGKKGGTVGERIVYSLIAIAYGAVVVTGLWSFTFFMGPWQWLIGWIAPVVWLAYLILLRRSAK